LKLPIHVPDLSMKGSLHFPRMHVGFLKLLKVHITNTYLNSLSVSKWTKIKYGVMQGSILDPHLTLFMQNSCCTRKMFFPCYVSLTCLHFVMNYIFGTYLWASVAVT
jgi:hypothetical protein